MRKADGRVEQQRARAFWATQFGVNLVMTLGMTAVMTGLVFHGRSAVPLWGMGNLAFDLIPSTVMPCLAATIGMTRAIAAAAARGQIPPTSGRTTLMRASNNVLAGLMLGAALLTVLGPAFIGVVSWRHCDGPVPFFDMFAYKLAYAVVLCCANSPLIINRALALAALRSGSGAQEKPAV